ncbi:MAG: bacillithiol biosynthesis cysteine-adding enzyme BshC [Bacteroidota bacterium]|nr:bacillithiol biosynthesis cysteine-adding enzyme BshC [Bacteroidota bacterium]
MSIPFNSLPSYSELFLNYINDFDSLRKFYEYDFRSDQDFLKCIELKKQTYLTGKNFFRNDICEIIKLQNQNFNSAGKSFDNIQLLSEHDTFAVVTGQQLGLLSGPYYTILKAINTVQLADSLSIKFPEYKFVPIFWLESDDHDFLEINNINIISKENDLKSIKYFESGTESEKYLKPTGDIVLDKFINEFIDNLEESFNKTDFSVSLFNAVSDSYRENVNIKTAFARFLNAIIKDKGLIFIDPSDKEIKTFLKPVFKFELNTSPQSCEKVINTSVELEEKFDVQVKPKAINLFYIHEGSRYLLEPRDSNVYALKNSRQKFSKEELYGILESNPERFSWNVVTRPICQDYLLPTVAYIGGPSEISYFGQFKEAYKFFNVPMPVIYPRTSVTIIENRVNSFLEKHNIKFTELFNEKELNKKLLRSVSEVSAEQIFSDLKEELTGVFYTYEKELLRIDVNQTDSFSKRNKQYLESLEIGKDKFINAQAKHNEVISNQLKKVLLNVYPNSNLQERVLNISYFLSKYGFELIELLMTEVKIDDYEHQLIDVSMSRN